MNLELTRFSGGRDSTLGMLSIDGRWLGCFTLEDEGRTQKIFGKTRIPAGVYDLSLRKFGGFHERYARRFPSFHRGMIELIQVPGFSDILIHCGNTHEDTAGCLLVGSGVFRNLDLDGSLASSVAAYRKIYPTIARSIMGDDPATGQLEPMKIEITDPTTQNDVVTG